MDLKGFCAAPWVESVLYANGSLQTCCRNGTSFGNWQIEGLENTWHSERYQDFRKDIVDGRFPNVSCQNCLANGTARPLSTELSGPFGTYSTIVFDFLGGHRAEIVALRSQFELTTANQATQQVLADFFAALDGLSDQLIDCPVEVRLSLGKLRVIGQIAQAFLYGDLRPPIVAPFRQVQLQAKCNARCIQCHGLHTGEIINGRVLDEAFIDQAFCHTDEICDFFMNGSEFLLYKGWKKVASKLADHGVKLSISTNGIRLNPENIMHLIDNQIPQAINVSVDGATKETIEAIRVNVNYEELVANIAFLFSYATQKKSDFNLSISFVLMKRNFHEFPDLVRLIDRLRDKNGYPRVHINCQSLENYPAPDSYSDFVHQEHHTLVPREDLVEAFTETLGASRATRIPVQVFYAHDLANFISLNYPFPPLPPT